MYILDFTEIHKDNVAAAGGKGANLGEMTSAGIPVPPGFVITAEGYRHFISHNHYDAAFETMLREAGEDEARLCACAEKLRDMILVGEIPEELSREISSKYASLSPDECRVAVRSSATAEDLPDASFAGQQETYLNIRGMEELLDHVRKCYASLWGNRAVCYRFHQGYDQLSVALAVVIQEMVESEKAGVLFTVNPVTKDPSQIQINASYGLGESVVSGRVTADSILCDKEGSILQYDIGSKSTQIIYDVKSTREVPVGEAARCARALSDDEIRELCSQAKRIEAHYGYPMDIEWAIRSGRVYILQARAITTLQEKDDTKEDAELIASYLKGCRISGPARENMAFQLEKMPYAYHPFDYDLMIQINTQKAKIFQKAGIAITSDPRMDDDGIMTLPDPHKGITKNILHLPAILKEIKDYRHCAEMCNTFMPVYEKKLGELPYEEMDSKQCGDFLVKAYDLLGELCYDRFMYALFPSALSGKLTKAMKKIDPKYTNYDLYKGLDNKTSVITRDVAELAGKLRKNTALTKDILSGMRYDAVIANYPGASPLFQAFLDKNGYKSDYNCYCVIAKTLKEDPDRLLNILRPLLATNDTKGADTPSGDRAASTSQTIKTNRIDWDAAAKDAVTNSAFPESDNGQNAPIAENPSQEFQAICQKLSALYGKKYPALEEDIRCFRLFHIVREQSQYLWETLFYDIRRCLRRLNTLLLNSEDYRNGISNLFYRELLEVCKRGSLNAADLEKIERRSGKHALSQKVWDASKLLVFDSEGDTLKGVSGSNGTAVGRVCIIHSPAEFYKMKKGDILVCELTDPEWTPLFSLASAVVADTGSSLSHAAIVAREFGIPAVLGVGFATTSFKDGQTIKVDGDRGTVSAMR